MKKVIFWDYDGTLVHSEHLWSNSLYKVLKRHLPDFPASLEEIRSLTNTLYTWDTPENDYTQITGKRWWTHMENQFCEKYLSISVPGKTAKAMSKEIRNEILQVEKYHLYEDTLSTLAACVGLGYQNYILSNNYPELDTIIHKLGLAPYFQSSIISALVGYDKPRKEIFDYAIKAADKPDICYMVGDNPKADIAGAKQVGMKTILVHRNIDCNADYHFPTLDKIADILI